MNGEQVANDLVEYEKSKKSETLLLLFPDSSMIPWRQIVDHILSLTCSRNANEDSSQSKHFR